MKYELFTEANGTIRFVPDVVATTPPPPPAPVFVPPAPTPPAPTPPAPTSPAPPADTSGPKVQIAIDSKVPFYRFYTYNFVGTSLPGDVFVVQLNVDAASATAGRGLAGISFSDAGTSRGNRNATISQTKGDFSDSAQWITSNFLGTKTPGNAASATVAIGYDPRQASIRLTPGVWYLNIQNDPVYSTPGVNTFAVVQWATG